jgi:hypothetical protein
MTVDEFDVEAQQKALDCYVAYRETYDPPLERLKGG